MLRGGGRGREQPAHERLEPARDVRVSRGARVDRRIRSQRKAFGKSIGDFQNTKFVLAEAKTQVAVAQAYVDQCVLKLIDDGLDPTEAAQAKYFCTEVQQKVVDQCLQLFGGYGFMIEYPIARAYADARVTTIYGGTTEVMKTIIAKSLGL